jgi:hypothetical protein
MTTRRDDSIWDEKNCLRDGAVYRVRMTARDDDPETGAGERGSRGEPIEGTPCTVRNAEFREHVGSPGVLRKINGAWVCVPTKAKDAAPAPRFTDGNGDKDPTSANRPGWRIPVGDSGDSRRKLVDAAYAEYERSLVNRYRSGDQEKVCPECDGTGEDAYGKPCTVCGGKGALAASYERDPDDAVDQTMTHHEGLGRRDSTRDAMARRRELCDRPVRERDGRSVDQMTRDHQATMAKLYADLDIEIANMWRTR